VPVIVTGRAVGSRRPLFADWSVPLPPRDDGDGGLTLRDVIALVVRADLEAYSKRREARRLDRVLTQRDIERGEAQGRIAPEARETGAPPPVEEAISAAWLAFEDGMYLVAIDGQEYRSLDAQVFVTPDTRITFIRLVFLAGA
jgi:hypothetical protein